MARLTNSVDVVLEEAGTAAGAVVNVLLCRVCMHGNRKATGTPFIASQYQDTPLVYNVVTVRCIEILLSPLMALSQRSTPRSFEERVWHVFRADVVVPEYIVELHVPAPDVTAPALQRINASLDAISVPLFAQTATLDVASASAGSVLNLTGAGIVKLQQMAQLAHVSHLIVCARLLRTHGLTESHSCHLMASRP